MDVAAGAEDVPRSRTVSRWRVTARALIPSAWHFCEASGLSPQDISQALAVIQGECPAKRRASSVL
eukprot:986068-Pleurochrysis_carterae.AAC.1